MSTEANFDGLVGPTHNYAGLSRGNLASEAHRHWVSSPRRAALQGLLKMKHLADLGLAQGVLPPAERPSLRALRALGFCGTDAKVLTKAARSDPALLAACCSASSMWAANAATVSPSADTQDGRVHFTPANLSANFHRALEVASTARALKKVFPEGNLFVHHPPVPHGGSMQDEGAANHMRLVPPSGPAAHVFVYGRRAFPGAEPRTTPASHRHPARQAIEASEAVARLHGLDPASVLFAQQSRRAIDHGVFHNDVIAVTCDHVMLVHEDAYEAQAATFAALDEATAGQWLGLVVKRSELSLEHAVQSYLFNSQLVRLAEGSLALIAPSECEANPHSAAVIVRLLEEPNPIHRVDYLEVRESMRNGGGPACLRLRVVLTDEELRAVHAPSLLTAPQYDALTHWVGRHYRDQLTPDDLGDPQLLEEVRTALDELTRILGLGETFYEFQR